jgi:hypothetical protein
MIDLYFTNSTSKEISRRTFHYHCKSLSWQFIGGGQSLKFSRVFFDRYAYDNFAANKIIYVGPVVRRKVIFVSKFNPKEQMAFFTYTFPKFVGAERIVSGWFINRKGDKITLCSDVDWFER